jgi:hypothetical protein
MDNRINIVEITGQVRDHKNENHKGMKDKENDLIWSKRMSGQMYNGITSELFVL